MLKTPSLVFLALMTPWLLQAEEWAANETYNPSSYGPGGSMSYADPPAVGTTGQNTSSLVEGKVFRHIEDAFARRDQEEFERLYAFFLTSFPNSERRDALEKFRSFFYYNEELLAFRLNESMVRFGFPEAKTKEELSNYLKELKKINIASVMVDCAQLGGKKVFLFAKDRPMEGFYFKTSEGPVVENLLGGIVELAHEQGLQLYASLPLREHPALSSHSTLVLDQSWNFLGHQPELTRKLDLFNPAAKKYLFTLIEDLVATGVDGIILQRDYIYTKNEGFSDHARNMFTEDTGIDVHFDELFSMYNPKTANREFGLLTREEYYDYALWRTREVRQTLYEVIQKIRKTKKELHIGLELVPEFVLNDESALLHYSTGVNYLYDLEVDFFILSWRNRQERSEDDFKDYQKAALLLREKVHPSIGITLDIPLNEQNRNVIFLNKDIQASASLQQKFPSIQLVIGPVDRYERLDFLQFPRKEVADKEAL